MIRYIGDLYMYMLHNTSFDWLLIPELSELPKY